jgi:hypothetical protein
MRGTLYPKASDISSPPCLLRLLPAGAVAGRVSHPLESAAFARRTPISDIRGKQIAASKQASVSRRRIASSHAGAERDPLMPKDGRRIGVEFKRADAPQMTPSMRIALHDLALYAVYPGGRRYGLAERVQAVPLSAVLPMALR